MSQVQIYLLMVGGQRKDYKCIKLASCRVGYLRLLMEKIQAFPWRGWQEEFRQARKIGIGLMEWTLDHFDLYKNPFMTREGQKRDYPVV